MTDNNLEKLELRIQQLEKLISATPQRAEPTNLTADEVKAYHKVRDVMAADWGTAFGTGKSPIPLIASPCVQTIPFPRPPINECTCYPCLWTRLNPYLYPITSGYLGGHPIGIPQFSGLAE